MCELTMRRLRRGWMSDEPELRASYVAEAPDFGEQVLVSLPGQF
jgi:hypothetical protein